MVNAAVEAGVDVITDVVNQIIVEGVILAQWGLSTIISCYKEKGGSLERGNSREMKFTDQILVIAERIIEKLTIDK